ncbi:MAG: hypothetical protein AAB412_06845 [Elusimicrobiota bacterium]
MTFPVASLVLTVLVAAAVGALIHAYGGKEYRSWAVPVTGALLFGGVGYAYDLPDWAVIGGFLITPFVFHRTVRSRLDKAARRLPRVELPEEGLTLKRIPDPSGKHVAVWMSVPGEEAPREKGLFPTEKAIGEEGGLAQAPLIIALDFIGEKDDEYEVVLWTEAPKHLPGELVLHHRDSQGELRSRLSSQNPITGIDGLPFEIEARAFPDEYAFRVLDLRGVSAVAELYSLRTEDREIFVHSLEKSIRVVSTAAFSEEELLRLLKAASVFFRKVLSSYN